MKNIGIRLQKLRKTLCLTQTEFGKKINVSDVTISTAESGKTTLSNRNIQLICHEFNVNDDWLKSGEGEMFLQPNDIETEIVKIFRSLPNEGRAEVLSFIEYIVKKKKQ